MVCDVVLYNWFGVKNKRRRACDLFHTFIVATLNTTIGNYFFILYSGLSVQNRIHDIIAFAYYLLLIFCLFRFVLVVGSGW